MPRQTKRLVLLIVLNLIALDTMAASFTVTRFDDPVPNGCLAQDCSLREAVIAANATTAADSIVLGAGTYSLTRACTVDAATCLDLDVTRPLTISGVGMGSTIIMNGIPAGTPSNQVDRRHTRVLEVTGTTLTLRHLTMRLGRLDVGTVGASGGCLRASSTALVIDQVRIAECAVIGTVGTSGSGGGLSVDGGSLVLTGSEVVANTAVSGGGLFASNVSITGNNTRFNLNDALERGGGANLQNASLTLGNGSAFAANSAAHGGGLFLSTNAGNQTVGGSGSAAPNRLAFDENTATGHGGGLATSTINLVSAPGQATLRNLLVRGNIAGGNGGGASVFQNAPIEPVVTLQDIEWLENEAAGDGGALHVDVARATLASRIQRQSFYANHAASRGGALYIVGGPLVAHVSTYNNSAGIEGGSVSVAATSIHAATMATPRFHHLTTLTDGVVGIHLGRNAEFLASALASACTGPFSDLGNNVRQDVFAACPGVNATSAQMGLSYGFFGGHQSVVGITSAGSILRDVTLSYPNIRDARGWLRQNSGDIGAFEYDGVP